MGEALLVLEDGRTFPGNAYGAVGSTSGEAVFCTAMSGYQETLTDPSYHRQVVVMTAPHIGNTGWNDEDDESARIWVSGYVVRDPARRASSWRSRRELADELAAQGVVGISGIDTRALTRHLRERGAMRAGIFSGAALLEPQAGEASRPGRRRADDDLVAEVRSSPSMAGADLAGQVSTGTAYVVPATGERSLTVAAVDLGIKSMTPALMSGLGIEVHVVPSTSTVDEIVATGADGVFFSNGPGDPAATEGPIELMRELLSRRIPVFGICFGNQLLGRALGLDTFKLPYGHRGINQPVLDRTTGAVEVTAQNHGFAIAWPTSPLRESGPVETPFGRVEVSHIGLNDDVVEGLRCLDVPAFSVQFHPEAAAGPHDSAYLFGRFVDLMRGSSSPPPAFGNLSDASGVPSRQEGSQMPGTGTGTGTGPGTGRGVVG